MVLDEVHSVKEAIPAIGSLPKDIDGICFIPAPLRTADTERLTQAPISLSTPTIGTNPEDDCRFQGLGCVERYIRWVKVFVGD
jgi:hypothetical protein